MINPSIYPPTIVINGYAINQCQNCIQIIVPNGLDPLTTGQTINPNCKQYATKEDLIKILTLTASLFDIRGDGE